MYCVCKSLVVVFCFCLLSLLLLLFSVLAAHNGYQFDFPLLFSEITKHGMDFSFFKDNDFAFFDTYQHLLKVQLLCHIMYTVYI